MKMIAVKSKKEKTIQNVLILMNMIAVKSKNEKDNSKFFDFNEDDLSQIKEGKGQFKMFGF